MNALSLLKQDHVVIQELFHRFEQLGVDSSEDKAEVRDAIVEQLSVHAAIEEQVFYPAIRERNAELADAVLESLEEHHVVKWTLSELENMQPDAERFDAKMKVLIEGVRHHMKEEEDEMFPRLRDALTLEQLNEIGETLDQAKRTAPTRPHPRTPDTAPLNVLLGLPVSLLDKALRVGRHQVGRVLKRAS